MACGISLGGLIFFLSIFLNNICWRFRMILFNYLAKQGSRTPLEAAFVISVAWNINKSVISLEGPVNRFLFNKTLAESLADDIRTNSEIFESTMDLKPVYSVSIEY